MFDGTRPRGPLCSHTRGGVISVRCKLKKTMVTPVCHFSLVVKPLLVTKFLLESERIKKIPEWYVHAGDLGFPLPHFRRPHPLSRPTLVLRVHRKIKSWRLCKCGWGAVEFSFDRDVCATFIKLPWNEANLMVLYCDLQMKEPQYFLYKEILMLLRIEWVLHPAALAAFRFQSKWFIPGFIIALLWFVLVFTII